MDTDTVFRLMTCSTPTHSATASIAGSSTPAFRGIESTSAQTTPCEAGRILGPKRRKPTQTRLGPPILAYTLHPALDSYMTSEVYCTATQQMIYRTAASEISCDNIHTPTSIPPLKAPKRFPTELYKAAETSTLASYYTRSRLLLFLESTAPTLLIPTSKGKTFPTRFEPSGMYMTVMLHHIPNASLVVYY
eukprot:scaffold26981_cov80-Skeletonema_marinoi.AAC.3